MLEHSPLTKDQVQQGRQRAAELISHPLGAYCRDHSRQGAITKGLHMIALDPEHQLLLAWPGQTVHTHHGFAGWPTRHKYALNDIVLAGSVACHLFRDRPEAQKQFLDPETIANNGWLEMKEYRDDSVHPFYAVLTKDSEPYDSGEGYTIPAGQAFCLSFDQVNPTMIFRTHVSEQPRPFALYSDEGDPRQREGRSYSEEELSRLVDLVSGYLPMR